MSVSHTTLFQRVVPDPIRKRYLAKFASIVLIVALITVIASLYFQGQVSSELTHEVHNEMETVAALEADALHEWVQENEQNARMLSEYEAVKSGDSAAIASLFVQELDELPPTVRSINYVNLESGTVEQSTSTSMEGSSLSTFDLKWAHNSLAFDSASEVAVTEAYQHSDQAVVSFISPVEGLDMAVMISVDATERAEHFRDPIEGGYTQVVNSAGTIEMAADEKAVLTSYRNGESATVLQKASQEGVGVIERDETGEVVAYAPVAGTDWVTVAHAPQSNAYTLRSMVTRDFLMIVGISLAGFLFIGLTIGRNTVNVLNRLEDKALAIAAGQVDTQIEATDRIDEVGSVQDAFSETQSYLQTVSDQAEALASQDFDDPALQEDVPGDLGVALQTMQDDLDEFIVELEQAKAEAQESRAQAEQLAEDLEHQAEEFGEVMQAAADGDLTQRLDSTIDNEAMAEIADGFNEMLAQLEQTVIDIQQFATEVATASDEVASGSEEVENASNQVARSVEEISDASVQQTESLEQVSGEMSDLSATVEEIASQADEIAKVSDQAADRGESGREVAANSIEQMQEIENKTDETVDEIEDLDSEMARIGDIIELIEEIAEQTNMLALNASIEAANADDSGDGFAVVADEIKSLAQETQDATDDIEALVTEVQEATTEAATDMREMRNLVTDGMSDIEDGITALEDMVDYVDDVNNGVQSISTATDEQAASTQEVVSMVEDVSALSQNNTDEAQDVSAAAEEQTASVSQIATNAQTLTDQAGQLQQMVDKFTVDTNAASAQLPTAQSGTQENVATDGSGYSDSD